MALDVGARTLGVALSDELGITAQPATTIRRRSLQADLKAIQELVARHDVTSLVVGLPLRLSGDSGTAAEGARRFAAKMQEALGVPVHTWDERFTTVEAERALLEGDVGRRRRREVVNQVAAALILQSYLDSRRPPRP